MEAPLGISISTLPGAVLRIGADGRVLDLNDAAEQLECRCHPQMWFVDCLGSDEQEELNWRLSSMGKLPPATCELEVRIRDRLYRLVLARQACADGSRFVQLSDITDYRALSERVAINEQRYRSLFSQNPDAVCSLDLQGKLVETNQATETLTGYSKDSLCNYHWDSMVEESDKEAARECFQAALAGNPCSYRCRVRHRNGRIAITQVTYMPIIVDKKVVGVFGVARDKTERYRLEESRRLLQACMAQTQDVIIITETDPLDPPGPRIIYVNEGVERMTGYRPDELLGRTPRVFQGPDTDRSALARIREALEREKPIKEVLVNYCKDGQPFWNEIEIVPVPATTPSGRSYYAAVQRDITITKQREARLRHSEEELRRLSRAQDGLLEQERRRIARDLHDELGQTLTALKLNLAMAVNQLEGLSPDQRRRLDFTVQSVDGAVETVREISANLRPPMLDDLGFEAAAEWLLERSQGQGGLSVRWHSEPAGDSRVGGEVATALFRILQECLTNVIRHSSATEVRVDYRETDGRAVLEVRDNGVGFDPGRSRTSGFGLVGVRERVTMLGGDLTVESAIGKGTRILVELPLERASDD